MSPNACTPVSYNGADAVRLQREGMGTVVVLLQGGHVVSWQDPSGTERLYLSSLSPLDGTTAVRGGVPVIFPQFSTRGPLGRHGFARTQRWRRTGPGEAPDDPLSVTLELASSPATLALWPESFRIELRVSLAPWQLTLELSVHNTGQRPWAFTGALHTYLAAGPLGTQQLHGLEQCPFEDALASGKRRPATGERLVPHGAVDRIYFGVNGPLELNSPLGQMTLTQTGWPDTVVWNPGATGSQALTDLPDNGYDQFLCVEAALAGQPQTVRPGYPWQGAQILHARPPVSTRLRTVV
jgi:glucose-6-phosphate 1-epimerase